MAKGITANAPPPLEFQFKEKNFYTGGDMDMGQVSWNGMPTCTVLHCTIFFFSFDMFCDKTWSRNTDTYRVDLDQVGVPGISRDSDIVVAQLALVGGTVDVSKSDPKKGKMAI